MSRTIDTDMNGRIMAVAIFTAFFDLKDHHHRVPLLKRSMRQ